MTTTKNRMDFLLLLQKALDQAAKKKGHPAKSMTIAVLNNRLLQLTDRHFKPEQYGAGTLRDLLETFAPKVKLVQKGQDTVVVFQGGRVTSAATPNRTTGAAADSSQTRVTVEGHRIRSDLWKAVMDFSSGHQYVWDEAQGLAREATANDSEPVIPTVTPELLDTWRTEFVETHRSALGQDDLRATVHWKDHRLPTSSLPAPLQQLCGLTPVLLTPT
jgi:hypothetical protein